MTHYRKTAALALCAVLLGCGGGGSTGGNNPPPNNPAPPPASPPPAAESALDPNGTLNVRQLAKSADSYAIYYGALDATRIQTLKTSPLVIVHPSNGGITRDQVREIQHGVNSSDITDNVVVLCYISIGEDSRTINLTDAQMLADPRFVGDGTGPSIDPRGTGSSARPLTGLTPLGTPTNGGFASWYLNDNWTNGATSSVQKSPDVNPNFKGRYTNAGDPKWYDVINNELADAAVPAGYPATPPGLKEMLTTTYGRGLGCDGVFLDTIDTAAPNYYAPSISNFEWTASGFTDFMKHIRQDYPDKVILQNRGVFFFDPRQAHYEVSARGTIDLFLFESYRMDSDPANIFNANYFPDNKFNYAPKLMAEANRADGFRVISLGYGNGWGGAGVLPKPGVDINTLVGTSIIGKDIFMTDINEALAVGFRPYLTDAPITLINSFVKTNAVLTDTNPPVWTSTYNANPGGWPTPPAAAPAPRVGIQLAVSPTPGSLTLSWDVALDMNHVGYALYYQTASFDFINDPNLTKASRVVLNPVPGTGYSKVWSGTPLLQAVYPNEQTISGLTSGTTYNLIVRAFDSADNEEKNQVVLSAAP